MVFKNTMRVCLSMDDACRLPSAPASLKVVLSGTEAWVHDFRFFPIDAGDPPDTCTQSCNYAIT